MRQAKILKGGKNMTFAEFEERYDYKYDLL
uniref:Uncharacterized protein n=1 Tax=Dulem virus 39 TaxID=3145757 RepID=A0AAU8B5A3_9CAUD